MSSNKGSNKGKRSSEESASAAGDDSNVEISLSDSSDTSEDEDEELVVEEGNKKNRNKNKSKKGSSSKKSSSSAFGKFGKWVRGHTYSNAKQPRVIGSDNVKLFGGMLKAGFVGVEIPKDTFMDMCKGAAKWAEKNGLVGSQIGGKARTSSVGAGAKAFFALIEPIVPPMAVRLLFFCFFVIAMMDAVDPTIIKMRTYGEFTYTITAAVAFGVFSILWLISDRKQTVVGSLMVLSLGGGLLAAGLVDHLAGWNASYDVLSDHLRYIKIVHLLYALGMGVTIMSMIQTLMNNKIKSS